MNLGGPEVLILLLIAAMVAIPILTLVDIVSKPAWAFERANQNRTLCLVIAAAGVVFCGLGIIVAVVWFAALRPKVVEAAATPPPAG